MKTITHGATLEVTGHIWRGHKCNHSYSLPAGKPYPKTLAEAKSIAGDFADLTSAKVVHIRREVIIKTLETILK